MIRFITAGHETVENVMNYVNDYINYEDTMNVFEGSRYFSVSQSLNSMKSLLEPVNRDYMITAERQINSVGKFVGVKNFIKRCIRKLTKWYMKDILEQQVMFNGEVVRCINAEAGVLEQINQELIRIKTQDKKIYKHISYNKSANESLNRDIELINKQGKTLADCVNSYGETIEDLKRKISETGIEFDKLRKQIGTSLPDEWYVEFENNFRGDTAIIRKRQEMYVEFFKEKNKVVDLGCGRGEFLTLLKENNIPSQGADTNQEMVNECLQKQLDVVNMDCLQYLTVQEDESIGGIFASQLVEHISKQVLYDLIKVAYQKLEREGLFILETVNPLTLGVFCYGFYIDPEHTFPVHPSMLRFMAESVGFQVEPVGFLNEFPIEYRFKINDTMDHNEIEIVNKLNEQLYGAQDYYLICRKR